MYHTPQALHRFLGPKGPALCCGVSMLTLPLDCRRVGYYRFHILLLCGPPLLELAWSVSALPPAVLTANTHGDLEAATTAHEGTSIGGTVVAVGGGAAFEHRDCGVAIGEAEVVVLRFSSRMLREYVD